MSETIAAAAINRGRELRTNAHKAVQERLDQEVGTDFPIDAFNELLTWLIANCFPTARSFVRIARRPGPFRMWRLYNLCADTLERITSLEGSKLAASAYSLANALLEEAGRLSDDDLEAIYLG